MGSKRKPLSREEQEKRRPPPPYELIDALQDRVHKDIREGGPVMTVGKLKEDLEEAVDLILDLVLTSCLVGEEGIIDPMSLTVYKDALSFLERKGKVVKYKGGARPLWKLAKD